MIYGERFKTCCSWRPLVAGRSKKLEFQSPHLHRVVNCHKTWVSVNIEWACCCLFCTSPVVLLSTDVPLCVCASCTHQPFLEYIVDLKYIWNVLFNQYWISSLFYWHFVCYYTVHPSVRQFICPLVCRIYVRQSVRIILYRIRHCRIPESAFIKRFL